MSKSILITGGSRGIGRAVALAAAKRHWNIAFTYINDEAAAQKTQSDILAAGGKSHFMKADASKEADVIAAFDAAEKAFGRIDGFVNNAGFGTKAGRLTDKSASDMARLFEVNILGAYLGAKEAVRRMSAKGGAIVNISSAATRLGMPNEGVDYAGSKAIMDTLTIGLSKEVGPQQIRVNAVRPGLIATDFHAIMGKPTRAQDLGPSVPLGREGSADEVAEAVIWLLSDEASYVTGALLDVTGGR